MPQEWFYSRDGKKKEGPFSSDQLRALAETGQLLPTDMVVKSGAQRWVTAKKIAGLFAPLPLPQTRSAERRQVERKPASVLALVPSAESKERGATPSHLDSTPASDTSRAPGRSRLRMVAITALFIGAVAVISMLYLEREERRGMILQLEEARQAAQQKVESLTLRAVAAEEAARKNTNRTPPVEEELNRLRDNAERDRKTIADLERQLKARTPPVPTKANGPAMTAAAMKPLEKTTESTSKLKKQVSDEKTKNEDLVGQAERLREELKGLRGELKRQADSWIVFRKQARQLSQQRRPFEFIDSYALAAPEDVEKSLDTLAAYLTVAAEDESEKARSVYRWISNRISYDFDSFVAKKHPGRSAEDTLRTRQAVCAGFASLYAALCQRAGLEVVIVPGYAKGYGGKRGEEVKPNHDWNAVKIRDEWRLVDVTWDSESVIKAHKKERQRNVDKGGDLPFFLCAPETMVLDHLPNEEKWQLLDRPVKQEEFCKRLLHVNPHAIRALRASGVLPVRLSRTELENLSETIDEFNLRALIKLGVEKEKLWQTITSQGFRGLVFATTSSGEPVVLHEAPLGAFLRAGTKLAVQIKSSGVTNAAISNGKSFFPLIKKKDGVFEGDLRVQQGIATVRVQRQEKGEYSHVLTYFVETGAEKEVFGESGSLEESPNEVNLRIHPVAMTAKKLHFIRVEATPGQYFSPSLGMESASGSKLDPDFFSYRTGPHSSIAVFTPRQAGTYRITVSSSVPGQTGAYRLCVQR